MTEFKKIQQLLDHVREHVQYIVTTVVASTTHPHALYAEARQELVSSSSDLLRRERKLHLKAIETDPNKQIYNENMCARIVDLHESVAMFFGTIGMSIEVLDHIAEEGGSDASFGSVCPLAASLQELYETAVVTAAMTSEWAAAVAGDLATLLSREEVARVVLVVEERAASMQLFGVNAKESRAAARAAEDARSAARWHAEMHRRDVELHRPTAATAAAVLNLHRGSVDSVALTRLCKRLIALLREVRANPERQEIRTLRYIPLTLEHFGHPAVATIAGCTCAALNTIAELVLKLVGYQPKYITKPSFNTVVIELFAPSSVPFPMPCGTKSVEHTYKPVGYEEYGERTLVLAEPDPQTEMDAWCTWHETFDGVVEDLSHC